MVMKKIDDDKLLSLVQAGSRPADAARKLGVGRSAVSQTPQSAQDRSHQGRCPPLGGFHSHLVLKLTAMRRGGTGCERKGLICGQALVS